MLDLVARVPSLPAMTDAAIEAVRELAGREMELPQIDLDTRQVLHARAYTRTVCLPAGSRLTGALIKTATQVFVWGDVIVRLGDGASRRVTGHHIITASAGRKQVFDAIRETYITMVFGTLAQTDEEAEREFTDEFELLVTRRDGASNHVTITGE